MTLEDKKMEKVFKVSGMMCHHCESRVEKAVSAIPGVESVKADAQSGTVTVNCPCLDASALIKAITDAGYTVEA